TWSSSVTITSTLAAKNSSISTSIGLVNRALIARKLESEGVAAAVINARFTKPIDVEMLEFFAASVDVIVTLEDHVLRGGFGSAVLEELSNLGVATPVVRIGWPDQFIEHGKIEALRQKYGVTAERALEKLRPYLDARTPQAVAVRKQ
ncbi:MAG TPA: transketolase C-terminal domain-containing protein, partial [Bryobacteraceae bacterium]